MTNKIFNLAIISIALLSGSTAFATVHHKHNAEVLDLTETVGKIQNHQGQLQAHNGKLAVLANHKNNLGLTSSAHQVNLTTEHHYLKVSLHWQKLEKQLNSEGGGLAHFNYQLDTNFRHNFSLSKIHENIGNVKIGSG